MKTIQNPSGRRESAVGMTLLELLVVVAIIAVLGAIAVTSLGRFQAEATRKTAETQKELLNSGMAQYVAIYGDLPAKEDLSGRVLYSALTGDGAGVDGSSLHRRRYVVRWGS